MENFFVWESPGVAVILRGDSSLWVQLFVATVILGFKTVQISP